jgi:hypothetical protein
LRGSTVVGLCRCDHRFEPFDDRGRQHLIEVFECEATHAGIGRPDALHGRVERVASNDGRQQQDDVVQIAGAVFWPRRQV